MTTFLLLSVAGLLMWGTLSDKRTDLLFTIVVRPRQRSHCRVTYLMSQIWDSLDLEGQFPIFISPMNRIAQLYPQLPNLLLNNACFAFIHSLRIFLRVITNSLYFLIDSYNTIILQLSIVWSISYFFEVSIIPAFYPQKLAQTLSACGGRSVGIVRSRNQATEFRFFFFFFF
jgi:hypothetical protein